MSTWYFDGTATGYTGTVVYFGDPQWFWDGTFPDPPTIASPGGGAFALPHVAPQPIELPLEDGLIEIYVAAVLH